MKQLLLVLLSFLTVFCISCNWKKNANDDIIIAKDGSKSKKTVIEKNADNTPKVVYYYKMDKDGNTTGEITREEHFYQGGKKYVEGNINKGKKNGEWFAYHKDGSIQTSAFYVNGVEDGEYKTFRENGKPCYTGLYKMGVRIGEWKEYYEDGNVKKLTEYDESGNVKKIIEF